MTEWNDNDALFFRELIASQKYVVYVGAVFLKAGLNIRMSELEIRMDVSQRETFAENEVDLWVEDKPIEVKSRNLTFTNDPESFPYDTVIVDTLSGWNAKKNKPFAVVFVAKPIEKPCISEVVAKPMKGLNASDSSSGILAIKAPTSSTTHRNSGWIVKTKHDAKRGIEVQFLMAPKSQLITMETLIAQIKNNAGTNSLPV